MKNELFNEHGTGDQSGLGSESARDEVVAGKRLKTRKISIGDQVDWFDHSQLVWAVLVESDSGYSPRTVRRT